MFTVFKRTAKNFKEYSSAEKIVVETDLSIDEAREMCQEFNANRTDEEIAAGTKLINVIINFSEFEED